MPQIYEGMFLIDNDQVRAGWESAKALVTELEAKTAPLTPHEQVRLRIACGKLRKHSASLAARVRIPGAMDVREAENLLGRAEVLRRNKAASGKWLHERRTRGYTGIFIGTSAGFVTSRNLFECPVKKPKPAVAARKKSAKAKAFDSPGLIS